MSQDTSFWIERLQEIRRDISEIDAKMAELKDRRAVLVKARRRATDAAYEAKSDANGGDPDLVPVVELLPYVNRAIMEYGQIRIFCHHAKVSERLVRKMRNEDKKYVTLGVADRLMIASGRPEITASLTVIPKHVAYSKSSNGDAQEHVSEML